MENTLAALQKWANFHRKTFKIPVLSVTGSYGKTVIKEWINFIAQEKINVLRSPKSYNSQFGAALTLLSLTKYHELAIIETGISMPGEMDLMKKMIEPSHVILSNIGREHIENFSSIDELRIEKEKILKELEYLSIAVNKTSGIKEKKAWKKSIFSTLNGLLVFDKN